MILTCLTSCQGNGCGGACLGRGACGGGVEGSNGGLRDENVHCWESTDHCGDCMMVTQTACMEEMTCLLQGVSVGLQGGGDMVVS